MYPAVPTPRDVPTPVDFKLKPGWRYERKAFRSSDGQTFSPAADLPEGSRIVYKVPTLARADERGLSAPERELRGYMQLILPMAAQPGDYLAVVRQWPAVAEVTLGPDVSLPAKPTRPAGA